MESMLLVTNIQVLALSRVCVEANQMPILQRWRCDFSLTSPLLSLSTWCLPHTCQSSAIKGKFSQVWFLQDYDAVLIVHVALGKLTSGDYYAGFAICYTAALSLPSLHFSSKFSPFSSLFKYGQK